MRRLSRLESLWLILVLGFGLAMHWGCGSGEPTPEELKARQRAKEIEDAKQVAGKLRDEKPFDFDQHQKKIVRDPENVCMLMGEFRYMDLGPNPDFYQDGDSAVYHDKWTNLYFRNFNDTSGRVKFHKGGRNPAWNKSSKATKVIYERFRLNPNDWNGVNEGIEMIVPLVSKEPELITKEPGTNPFFVNDDRNIVYRLGDQYILLDDKLERREITREEYTKLVEGRYEMNCNWKVGSSFEGVSGVWVSSLDDRYHAQVHDPKSFKTLTMVPQNCYIYVWSDTEPGLVELKPFALPKIKFNPGEATDIKVGDVLRVYAIKRSPLTDEVIGFYADQWKGNVRVLTLEGEEGTAEYQTRLAQAQLAAGDVVALAADSKTYGTLTKVD
jgi:hypothetical protein